ncbi:MAG: ACP S-malonyltransferase [bacterium]
MLELLKNKRIVLLFPGQASQYINMGMKLYESDNIYRQIFDKIADYINKNFKEFIDIDLRDLIKNVEYKEKLDLTKYSQIAIFSVSISSFYFLREYVGDILTGAGHSLGEYTLLTAFNSLDLYDAINLVIKRGYFMYNYAKQGTMFAVIYNFDKNSINKLNEIVKKFNSVIANYNSYNQLIVSCSLDVVDNLKEEIKKEFNNVKIIPLKVSGAFHSPLVNEANEIFKQEIFKTNFNDPIKSVFINSQKVNDKDVIKNLMMDQMVRPVNWIETIENINNEYDNFIFIELLPNKILSNLIQKGFKNISVEVYSLEDLLQEILV